MDISKLISCINGRDEQTAPEVCRQHSQTSQKSKHQTRQNRLPSSHYNPRHRHPHQHSQHLSTSTQLRPEKPALIPGRQECQTISFIETLGTICGQVGECGRMGKGG